MVEPTVSVIIPAYNAQRFLEETLNSVAQQQYRDFEIVLVDDGSIDDTAIIAQNFEGVRYNYQENRGPAAARNLGLGLSRGRIVAFLDADDVWHESMLGECLKLLNMRPSISAVHTNWLYIDEQGELIPRMSGWQPWRGRIFERLLVTIPLINPAIVWRRQCFEEIGGFDQTPEVNDDWLNWLRIAYRGHLFECVEQPLAFYRKHRGNLTLTQNFRVIEWRKRALDLILSEIDVDPRLRSRAYAQVHWVKSMAALACSEVDEAAHEFGKAVALNEQLLWQAETYYAIAFGGEGSSTTYKLDTEQAEANLTQFMVRVEGIASDGEQLSKQTRNVWGEAYYHLARMAYGSEEISPSEARTYLWRAARANPSQFALRERAAWALRVLAGRGIMRGQRAKKA